MPAYRETATIPDLELPYDDELPDQHQSASAAADEGGHHDLPMGDSEQGNETEGSQEGLGPHAKAHRGRADEHGAGAHGGKWLITYCDMVTLLITFFICILTFASKENGSKPYARQRDSLIYGTGGSGAVGDKSANADAVVWRQVLSSVSLQSNGSSSAPQFSEPQLQGTDKVFDLLDKSGDTILDENFSFHVPLIVLMSDAKTFSPSGQRLLGNIAFGLRQYSFDLIIQIDHPDVFPIAFLLSKKLTDLAGCPPSRTGISLLENGARKRDSVRFMFMARK